ncbi:hypothetical protein ACTFIV_011316, partial [Dictyostelium citrinum]
DMKLMQ